MTLIKSISKAPSVRTNERAVPIRPNQANSRTELPAAARDLADLLAQIVADKLMSRQVQKMPRDGRETDND